MSSVQSLLVGPCEASDRKVSHYRFIISQYADGLIPCFAGTRAHPYGGGLLPPHPIHARDKHSRHREPLLRLCPRSRVWRSALHLSSRASFAWRSAFFDMENVYSEDYVGVSPRKVNYWQKVWGSLIPTKPKGMDQGPSVRWGS